MKHSKVIHGTLSAYRATQYWPAVGLIILDTALYVGLFLAICLVPWWWLKVALGLVLGIVIGRLAQLGHTASHRALFPQGPLNRRLSRPVGVFCCLPWMMPEWSWDIAHNRVHHIVVQRVDADVVWCPLSKKDYLAASSWRRLRERLDRHLAGLGFHYFWHDWLNWFLPHMFRNLDDPRARTDLAALSIFVAVQITVACTVGGPWWLNLVTAWLLPFFVWCQLLAMCTYFHHTHEGAVWHQDGDQRPSLLETAFEGSRNVTLPWRLDWFLHALMDHKVHHLAPLVPCYRQRAATKALNKALGVPVIEERITWRRAFAITAHCQLYDFEARQWCRFSDVEENEGKPTPAGAVP